MDIMDVVFLAACFVVTLATLYGSREKWPHRIMFIAFAANVGLMFYLPKPPALRIFGALMLTTAIIAEVYMAKKKRVELR